MNHNPARDEYLHIDAEASPLSDDDRENIRRATRTLLARVSDERELDIEGPDAITTVHAYAHDGQLSLDVYAIEDEIDTNIKPNERVHPDGSVTTAADPHRLRDLGPAFERLEADLISEMVLMLDLPEYIPELANHAFEPFGFLCTSAIEPEGDDEGPFATFGMSFAIPETTQQIYDEDRFDLADHIGIPMLD